MLARSIKGPPYLQPRLTNVLPSPSPVLLSDRECPVWFFAIWAEAVSRVGWKGGELVTACRRWLGILIVVPNDEDAVMRRREERLHADAIDGLLARKASLPP
jgi:hypothetical protein